MKTIEKIIKETNQENENKVNWTKAWSNKYPVLKNYQKKVDIRKYANKIRNLLESLKDAYNYSERDAMLVLKDILYHEWKDKK